MTPRMVAGRKMTSHRHDGRFGRLMLRLVWFLVGIVASGCRRKATESRVAACYDCRNPYPVPGKCREVQSCLRATLPTEYDGPLFQPLSPTLNECLGATPAEVAAAAPCAPFRFGTDRRNGRPVEVYATCVDVCPDHFTYGVRHGDITQEECACLAGRPEFEEIVYVGCYPSPDHLWFRRREEPMQVLLEYGRESTALTVPFGSRLSFFQLKGDDVVESVNGKPVRDAASLDRVFRLMPELAPDVITLRRGTREEPLGSGVLPSVVEVHYVSQEVLREIERAMNDEHTLDGAPEIPSGWRQMPGSRTIIVGSRYRSWVSGGTDLDSQRLDAAAARIASVAKASRHFVPESAPTLDCREVGGMLKRVALVQDKRSIELTYIDWVEAKTRTADKIAALRDAGSPWTEGDADR